jgi:hypothetical protein
LPRLTEIFTPSSVPTYTYVDREKHRFEEQLREALRIPNMIVSLSGPSKSGKTVLLRKVVHRDNLIELNGASIKSPDDLWAGILRWMDVPEEKAVGQRSDTEVKGSIKGGGEAGIPFVAKGKAEAGAGLSHSEGSDTKKVYRSGGLTQVVREIADSDYSVFLDDFHYIPVDVRPEIARQIKAGAEQGIRFCTASVPHRSDDVVRSNPELHGRVKAIDLKYWDVEELSAVAAKGFEALNVSFEDSVITRLVGEAFRSPQLMQALCLNLGFVAGIEQSFLFNKKISCNDAELATIFERTSTMTDFSSLLEALHAGPKLRGQDRNKYDLVDGTNGDVYRCILLALKQDPGRLTYSYDQMLQLVRDVCEGNKHPPGSSISEALEQIDRIAVATSPSAQILEWDRHNLDIVEPYFMFFLRKSMKLASLAE